MGSSEQWHFPGGLVVKNSPAKVGDARSIPGSGKSPEEGNGKQIPTPVLVPEESHGQRNRRAAVHRVIKNQTRLGKLNNFNTRLHMNSIHCSLVLMVLKNCVS